MRRALFSMWLAAASCGSNPTCDALASKYAQAIAAARRCDPAATPPCTVARASLGAGSTFCDVTGISSDPAARKTVDDLLGEFAAAGCPLGPALPCPEIPSSAFECRSDGTRGPTCRRAP